jgi:uncharacterized protein YbaP (TraB family)
MKFLRSKSFLALGFFVLIAFQSFAQNLENSLLWRISGKGLKQDSYLFGTIHIICEEQFWMEPKIEKALESAQVLALEIDMTDPNLMAEMQQLSINPGFKNIKGEFTDKQAAALSGFLTQHYGAGLDQLGILKPFVLSSMVMIKMLPCEQQSSYETFFTEKAKSQGKKVIGLETAAFQIGMFDQIPQKIQIDDLAEMVTEKDALAELNQLVETYLSQDLDKIYQIITDNEMFQQYGDLLLKERNENWIPKIEELIQNQSAFIAVGAGHLPSDFGVIQLLRKAGYKVEAVK